MNFHLTSDHPPPSSSKKQQQQPKNNKQTKKHQQQKMPMSKKDHSFTKVINSNPRPCAFHISCYSDAFLACAPARTHGHWVSGLYGCETHMIENYNKTDQHLSVLAGHPQRPNFLCQTILQKISERCTHVCVNSV